MREQSAMTMIRTTFLAAAAATAALALAQVPASAAFVCNTPDCVLPTSTTTPGGSTSFRSQAATRFSIGLQMDLFNGTPSVVAAVRHTVTLPHNQVYGGQGDISMPINLAQPLQWPTLRALGIAGNREIQALMGGGVVLGSFQPVATLALQVPYATAGLDYVYGRGFSPYAGVNSFARAVPPRVIGTAGAGSTTYSCPTGYTLTDAATAPFAVGGLLVNSAGKTCLGPS
jgi:hypothetical protein